jgi:omega-6 fatty acid desaturase (delta-12 desaturase)
VHHLSARVPNYNLQAAHDNNPIFHDVPVLTLRDGIRTVRLKLWDEERGRLVGFAEADAIAARQDSAGTQSAGNAPAGTSPA